jgi:hypothetical protein
VRALNKALKGGTHVRYDTLMRLKLTVGVELTELKEREIEQVPSRASLLAKAALYNAASILLQVFYKTAH